MNPVNRRQALALTAAGLAGCTALRGTHSGHIDAHSHIWTTDVEKFPLRKGVTADDLKPRSFTAEGLIELGKTEGVTRHVLISHGPYYGYDNDYMTHTTAGHPGVFAVVGALNPALPDLPAAMRTNRRLGITGYRILPRGQANWLQAKAMQTMWHAGAEQRIAMCPLIDPKNVAGLGPMCEKFPDTPVVIDHCARIDAQHEKELTDLLALAKHPNVHVKISAFYAFGTKQPPYDEQIPRIKALYESFGARRLMWASDCPYQLGGNNTYAASIGLIRDRIDFFSAEDKQWLLRRTAEKIYFD